MGTLTTNSNTRILVPHNEEGEELQLRETLQPNIMEKRAPNIPYRENVGLSGLEQQGLALEETARLKVSREATLVRDEGTSQQQGTP